MDKNFLVINDKKNRQWKIEFPEYVWKIYKGTDPDATVKELIGICSNIEEEYDYCVHHDTVTGYGIYLTMIQFDYEDDTESVTAVADYYVRKGERNRYSSIMRDAGYNMFEFRSTKHTVRELDTMATNIMKSKFKADEYHTIYTNIRDYKGTITYRSCFHSSDFITLKNMFQTMMANFKWEEIRDIIYNHSICGVAFCNATERCATRDDDIIYLIPSAKIIHEEFRKLLIKYERRGYNLQHLLRKEFVEDHDTKKEA